MLIKILFFSCIYFLINKFFLKADLLLDKKQSSDHKKKIITKNKTPLTGGLIFLLFFLFFYFSESVALTIAILFLYLIGVLSDINILGSPIKRIVLQTICIILFVIIADITIKTVSVNQLDEILNIRLINIIFLTICFLVLINGFNFLDGINSLAIGYFLICLSSIYFISEKNELSVDLILLKDLLLILAIIFAFNFFGNSFLGDSGTYIISFLLGVLCVNFAYENYIRISPHYVVCLLWYPAFENLFSIIRRVLGKLSPSKPDNYHLHHLLYFFIGKKTLFKKKISQNTITGIIINIYNVFSISIASFYYNHTNSLIIIIMFNLFVYLYSYYSFNKYFMKFSKIKQ